VPRLAAGAATERLVADGRGAAGRGAAGVELAQPASVAASAATMTARRQGTPNRNPHGRA
jgi:hypothetical protein